MTIYTKKSLPVTYAGYVNTFAGLCMLYNNDNNNSSQVSNFKLFAYDHSGTYSVKYHIIMLNIVDLIIYNKLCLPNPNYSLQSSNNITKH